MKQIITALALSLILGNRANADPASADLQSAIRSKAAASSRGVILALTEPGDKAAETAWLLAEQITPDNGYVPYLLVVSPEESQQIYQALKLPENNAPVLLVFDRQGREVSRTIGVRPVHVPWHPRPEAQISIVAKLVDAQR